LKFVDALKSLFDLSDAAVGSGGAPDKWSAEGAGLVGPVRLSLPIGSQVSNRLSV